MAPTTLASMRASCVKLRDAVDEWIRDFDASEAEARRLGVPMTRIKRAFAAKPKILRGPIAVQIVSLCSGERGASAADIGPAVGMTNKTAASRLGVLALRGHLVRVALPGRVVRFFAHAEHATAWGAGATASPAVSSDSCGPVLDLQCDEVAGLPGALLAQLSKPAQRLAAMVEADAPAVAAALAVIAPQPIPQPAPSAPPPTPYIPPTPTRARGERREQLAAAAFVAPVAKPTGDTIVPSTAKITVAPTPVDGRFSVDPKTLGEDPESFSAQWLRLRGEGAEA